MSELFGFFEVMGGEDDGVFGVCVCVYYVLELLLCCDVYVGCGFVEDEDVWVGEYCECEFYLLLFIFGVF